jgi:pyruvate dehydrogenase E2 component (dihydrolipoamide acetyltransferase)
MAATQDIELPDIGDFDSIDVIDVLIKPGDTIKKEDSVIVLESDKATMEIPSPESGTVDEVKVKVGDKISKGHIIFSLQAEENEVQNNSVPETEPDHKPEPEHEKEPTSEIQPESKPETATETPEADQTSTNTKEILLPDIGDFDTVDVIEIHVKPGDKINVEDPIITLESEKASMEIPSPDAGTVKEIKVSIGDKISKGATIILLTVDSTKITKTEATTTQKTESEIVEESDSDSPLELTQPLPAPTIPRTAEKVRGSRSAKALASPAVRKLARELGVDLGLVTGTGPRKRILKEDVKDYTKSVLSGSSDKATFGLPEIPAVDFSKFGKTELKLLSKIQKLTGQHLQRAWLTIPQVTQFDEADITDLEDFRKSKKQEAKDKGTNLTLVTFLVKAAVVALKKYPEFNSSLTSDGEALVLKNYFHIGIAVNTDNGLVVPVIRNADLKGLFDIALEITELSNKATQGKLKPDEMRGGCFSISSLGSIGGTGFTPIVNVPEVAIMGVSKSSIKPVYVENGEGGQFEPRLILPFSVSYDHRVIDGVAAARFAGFLKEILSDIRQILL